MSSSEVVVCSWNVHECVGRDGRRDPGRVATVMREIDADVLALQEVHSQEGAAGSLDQARFFSERLGLGRVDGHTLERGGGRYGNLVLTRLPIRAVRRHDLSVREREARGALEVSLESPLGPLRVVATHLGLRSAERAVQARTLLDLIEARGESEILAVLGDWNEWRPWGLALRLARRRFGAAPAPRTFPAWRPALALDRVWVEPRSRLADLQTHRGHPGGWASDHLPLVARLRTPTSSLTG